jgi:hypothetical protein
MTALRAAGTLLAADPGTRQLTYRLLPYGEAGRTNLGVITAAAGTVALPAAAAVVLNLEHERRRPVGRGRALVESAEGLDATFGVVETTAGNDLLAEAAAGLRTGASVELEDVVIRSGRLISARLVGAGAVVDPAFPSAQLVASDTGGDDDQADDDNDDDTDSGDNPQVTPAVIPVAIPDTDTDDDADSTDDTDSEADMTTTTTTAAAGTLAASRAPAGLPTPRTAPREPGFREIVRLLATAGRSGAGVQGQLFAALQAASPGSTELFAALSDITPGAGSVDDVLQIPQWLGEVWDGRIYQQRYLPLLDHKDLTAMQVKGWKWVVKPEVAPYAGNKAPVPSNAATTEPYVLDAFRIAGAHDIDRIFRDFNVEEFWTSYWAAMAESYAKQADAAVGEMLLDSAPYVAPGTVPANVSKAATYIVDGALAIIDTALPTFSIVSKDLYRELLLTRNEDLLAYLNMALGLEAGTVSSFAIVPGAAGFPADSVIVGAKPAATVYELPGTPIRVEALNIANGGIDTGLFGYMATGFNDENGLALVSGTAPVARDNDDDTATSSRSARRGRRGAKA